MDGMPALAGNDRLMRAQGVDVASLEADAQRFADAGKTPLFFAWDVGWREFWRLPIP